MLFAHWLLAYPQHMLVLLQSKQGSVRFLGLSLRALMLWIETNITDVLTALKLCAACVMRVHARPTQPVVRLGEEHPAALACQASFGVQRLVAQRTHLCASSVEVLDYGIDGSLAHHHFTCMPALRLWATAPVSTAIQTYLTHLSP